MGRPFTVFALDTSDIQGITETVWACNAESAMRKFAKDRAAQESVVIVDVVKGEISSECIPAIYCSDLLIS